MSDEPRMDEEQLSFLSEMLDEPTELGNDEDNVEDQKVEEEIKTESAETSVETPAGTETEGEEVVTADQTIESLRAQLLAMTEALQKDPLVQVPKAEVTTDEKRDIKTNETLVQFLSEEELDSLIDNPNLINVAFQRSQTAMLGSVSQLVQQEVNRQIVINRAITDFYTENNDLLPYSKFVQFVMTEIENKNRDKTYAEIFQTTASECRKRLGLSTGVSTNRETNKGVQKPAFVGSKKSNSRPAPTQEFFDANAADIFNLRD